MNNKILTTDLILQRTKTDNLFNIKNLNLWGNDLEDLTLLSKMPNLEVLSLSVNKISTLKDFASCSKLQELYLRKNNISDLSEIRYLMNLRNLKVLWLWDNPCAEETNYREIVIKCLPSLIKLDNTGITPEERAQGNKVNVDYIVSKLQEAETGPEMEYSRPSVGDAYSRKKSQPQMPPSKNYSPSYQYKENYDQPSQAHNPASYQYQKDQSIASADNKKYNYQDRSSKGQPEDNDEDNYVPPSRGYLDTQRNENILCAILALLKELDPSGLEFVRKDIDRKLSSFK